MVETREWHGLGVFDKAVPSWFDNVIEEHGLTEDGKTVKPIFATFCSQSITSPATQTSRLQVDPSGHDRPMFRTEFSRRWPTRRRRSFLLPSIGLIGFAVCAKPIGEFICRFAVPRLSGDAGLQPLFIKLFLSCRMTCSDQ